MKPKHPDYYRAKRMSRWAQRDEFERQQRETEKVLAYIDQAGGSVPVEQLDEDLKPMGWRVRRRLVEDGVLVEIDGKIQRRKP